MPLCGPSAKSAAAEGTPEKAASPAAQAATNSSPPRRCHIRRLCARACLYWLMSAFDPSGPAMHDGIFGLPSRPEEAKVVLVPVPWEATVSYGTGAADGPAAILRASRQVDLLDRETGRPYRDGIAMLPIPEDVRAWSEEARAKALPVIE